MAKLTDAQKEAGKIERRTREAGYKQARNEYEDDKEKSLSDFDAKPLKAQFEAADGAATAARVAINSERTLIMDQIAALQQQVADLPVKHNLDQLHEARRSASDAYFQGRREVEWAVDARHPNVARAFTASHWAANVERANNLGAIASDEEEDGKPGPDRMRA